MVFTVLINALKRSSTHAVEQFSNDIIISLEIDQPLKILFVLEAIQQTLSQSKLTIFNSDHGR